MKEKPVHLQPQYGAQFSDNSVAAAYHARPPYPLELFDILEALLVGLPSAVLELGAGTGDLTLELAHRVDHLDAIEPSAAMLAKALHKEVVRQPSLHWHQMTAEEFQPERQYGLVCASQSLHWMDWPIVMPMIAQALSEGGFLAIIERDIGERPWDQTIRELIPKYSTNQEFAPYDLVQEITNRDLFQELGRKTTAPVPFEQTMDDYIESFHSRNGFSRERMGPQQAKAFDTAVRSAAEPWCTTGKVQGQVTATVIWGKPIRKEK